MEGPRSAAVTLADVARKISDTYTGWEAKELAGDIRESILIIQSDCMQKPCDCFGYEIRHDHLKYIVQNDRSKIVHRAMAIGLDPENGEWSYIMPNGEFKTCRSCYDPENAISIIASEIASSMDDESTEKAIELANRIFAKFPR